MYHFQKVKVLANVANSLGWRTKRKIIVFESDDWGSIRMPSKGTYDQLLRKGYPVDQSHYSKYDCLESEEDYLELYKVLSSVIDSKLNPAIFTCNYVTSNPDFSRIRINDYYQYYYEDFTETYRRYQAHKNNEQLIRQGISDHLIYPQSHSREHLNVTNWMGALQSKDEATLQAFEHGMYTLPILIGNDIRNKYVDALYYFNRLEGAEVLHIVETALQLFEKQWGFISRSFMAPGYIWDSDVEEVLNKGGVKYIQGATIQLKPSLKVGRRYSKSFHFLGQKNIHNQIYLVRNAFFEPSENPNKDWVSSCLSDISAAFKWHKPAIVQTHRVNYMGSIDRANRTNNLLLLKKLLNGIIKGWPDIEFMSSVQLGDLIDSKDKQ